MKLSLAWIGDYLSLPDELSAEEIARRLTGAGLAVELIETVGGDVVFDLDITTNRPDCMNHLGVARELAALLGLSLQPPLPDLPTPVGEASASLVTLDNGSGCRRYVGRVLRGVTIGDSPAWLTRRLESIGLRPINNVVDVTNYVLWETGQPLHAFDLDTLTEGRVVVRDATAGETLRTLDGEDRALEEGMLVIADAARPVALAGVMGGEATEVTSVTTRILLESAWFDPGSVRHTARRLGMHTDASHRFERGSDPELCRAAADRAAALILELGGGEAVGETVDARGEAFGPDPVIELSLDRLSAFAGIELDRAQVTGYLQPLGFGLTATESGWSVAVPSWRRFDVLEAADLYEEVLRLHGFDAIPATLPAVGGLDAPELETHRLRRLVRRRLASCGFAQAINYAFYGEAEDSEIRRLDGVGEALALENPLSDLYRLMRRSMLPGLVASARFNRRRNLTAVRLFELGHVFWRGEGGEPAEAEHLAMVAGGRLGTPWERARDLDLFDLKGVLEVLVETLGGCLAVEPVEWPGLVPGTAARLECDGRLLGVIGELDEPDESYPLVVAELALESLLPLTEPGAVEIPSRFPGIAMDLTLSHPVTTPWAEIAAAIEAQAVPDLVQVGLKDRYQGEGVAAGQVNSTIFFYYNAADRSLTQEEVNERHGALTDHLMQRFGAGGT